MMFIPLHNCVENLHNWRWPATYAIVLSSTNAMLLVTPQLTPKMWRQSKSPELVMQYKWSRKLTQDLKSLWYEGAYSDWKDGNLLSYESSARYCFKLNYDRNRVHVKDCRFLYIVGLLNTEYWKLKDDDWKSAQEGFATRNPLLLNTEPLYNAHYPDKQERCSRGD